jgi:hypothetical protein
MRELHREAEQDRLAREAGRASHDARRRPAGIGSFASLRRLVPGAGAAKAIP